MAGLDTDLICAIATPPGEGGVGIIRLSGEAARPAAQQLLATALQPRKAHYSQFTYEGQTLDDGIVVYFPGPNSFTGEDVVEIQGHGSPFVLQTILQVLIDFGARLARPGEFSERAFLNGKLDLVQAEAIADLISAKSKSAARAARASLSGTFSKHITKLADRLLKVRIEIEAAIDFPEEDIEILAQAHVAENLTKLISDAHGLLVQAEQGRRLSQGICVALVGEPNVGKSSLLNALAGEEAAIVTNVPGTTRDLLKVDVVVEGVPLRLIDTAGLRSTTDEVERIGVERARQQALDADYVALIVSSTELISAMALADDDEKPYVLDKVIAQTLDYQSENQLSKLAERLHVVINKSDLAQPAVSSKAGGSVHLVSAKTGEGLQEFATSLVYSGYTDNSSTAFSARARHVDALSKTIDLLQQAMTALHENAGPELVAEDCLLAHQTLGEIVGTMTPDDLLGEIFSTFCIGK